MCSVVNIYLLRRSLSVFSLCSETRDVVRFVEDSHRIESVLYRICFAIEYVPL